MKNRRFLFGAAIVAIVCSLFLAMTYKLTSSSMVEAHSRTDIQEFNGERALADVQYQVALGPRVPGSEAHVQTGDWIAGELLKAGWQVEIQELKAGQPVRNVIGRMGKGQPWVLLGAHYDSRQVADRDPLEKNRQLPTPGANDGASGVAVLLEMARILPGLMQQETAAGDPPGEIWLVFFDAEDQGGLPDWNWAMGSQAFVDSLQGKPDAVVIVDMIGDADLNIYKEKNSTPALVEEIWQHAGAMGYETSFIPIYRHTILDDHVPFINAGIPAVDLIDIDYVYWHTVNDTLNKVSSESLEKVGNVLLAWLFD